MTYLEWRKAHPVLRKEANEILGYVYEHPGELSKFDYKLVYTLAYLGKIERVKDHDGIRVRLYPVPRRQIIRRFRSNLLFLSSPTNAIDRFTIFGDRSLSTLIDLWHRGQGSPHRRYFPGPKPRTPRPVFSGLGG
jgi:hypothetical protein